jgi:AraC-like DNA-binding protein
MALVKVEKIINIEGLRSLYYYENGKDFCFDGERHDFWELVYVDSGEISVVADETRYLVTQGNIIFHKPMEFHSFTSTNRSPHNIIVASFVSGSPAMSFFKDKIFSLNKNQKKILSSFVDEMKTVFKDNDTWKKKIEVEMAAKNREAYQIGILHFEHLLLDLMRENSSFGHIQNEHSEEKKNVENAFVERIKDFLAQSVYKSLTLSDVCEHFNMSKSYICRVFKSETGESVVDFYIQLKIKEAKLLIRKGDLNFTQISEALGYTSIHHFTRSFKSKTGMSPSAYEKSVW